MDDAVKWVRVGRTNVRVDQIAAWSIGVYNGGQSMNLYVTLLSGEKIQGETNHSLVSEFKEALPK